MKNIRKAFTFMELLIGLVVMCMVLTGVHAIFSYTRKEFMHGTVNLQNFQDVQLAINLLRRDFSSACPYIDYYYNLDPTKSNEYWSTDGVEKDYIALQKTRRDVFLSQDNTPSNGNANYKEALPIQIDESGISFHKFVFQSDPKDPHLPLVEEVNYSFNSTEGTLTRTDVKTGKRKVFNGFEVASFSLYVLKIAEKDKSKDESSYQEMPILWVYFRIYECVQGHKKTNIGKPLEMATSIISPYLASWMQNRRWRSDLGQKKL